MIIGNGSIAKLLNDREGVTFFAAGASNSSIVTAADIVMECMVMSKVDRTKMFVYFSTISIFTHDTEYTRHKKAMEESVKANFEDYFILRLGNLWECTNRHTFINAIKEKQRFGHFIEIRDEIKYMTSKSQLNFITDNTPLSGRYELSIFGEALTVQECLKRAK